MINISQSFSVHILLFLAVCSGVVIWGWSSHEKRQRAALITLDEGSLCHVFLSLWTCSLLAVDFGQFSESTLGLRADLHDIDYVLFVCFCKAEHGSISAVVMWEDCGFFDKCQRFAQACWVSFQCIVVRLRGSNFGFAGNLRLAFVTLCKGACEFILCVWLVVLAENNHV